MLASSMTSLLTPGSLFLLLNFVICTIYLISYFPLAIRPHHHQPEPEYGAPLLARPPSFLQRVKSFDFSSYNYNYPNHDACVWSNHDEFSGSTHEVFDDPTRQSPAGQQRVFDRAPSIVERVKSINFTPWCTGFDYVSYTNPQPQCEAPGSGFQQPARVPSFLDRVKSFDFTSFSRSDSIKENRDLEFTPDTTREPGHVNRSTSDSLVIQRKLPEKLKKSGSENQREREDAEEVERRRPESARFERTASIGESGDVDAKADSFIYKFRQQLMMQRLESFRRYKEMLKG